MMTIIEHRYYSDVKRIADNLKSIAEGMREVTESLKAMTQTTQTTNKKENEHGDND